MRTVKGLTVLLLLAVGLCFLLAGCAGQSGDEQGAAKEELVIALDGYAAGRMPPEGLGVDTCTQIYEPLLFLNDRLEIQPGLVTAWERIDPLTWRFSLREGVKFHNGVEFDATAAMFAFTMYLDEVKTGYMTQRIKNVVNHDSFNIIDQYTMEIKTVMPYSFLPNLMTHGSLAAVEPDAFKRGEIVGTGPYKYKEEARDQHVIVERNDDYWGEKPYFKRVVFKIVPDANTRVMALQKGEVDLALYPPYAQIEGLKNQFNIVTAPQGLLILIFNFDRPHLQDVHLRKALSLAFDREMIARELLYGNAEPAGSLIPAGIIFSIEDGAAQPDFSPEEAKRHLAAAGYRDSDNDGYVDRDGQSLELALSFYAPEQNNKSIAETIASAYQDIGIQTEIIPLEAAAYNTEVLEKGNFDVCLDITGIFWGGPSTVLFDHYYSKSGLTGYHRLADNEIDRLMEEGMELEADRNLGAAAEKYEALQKRALDDLAILSPVVFQKHVAAAAKPVKGFVPFPFYRMFYNGHVENQLAKIRWEE